MAASDAKPFPKKNEAYRVTFPIFDADGDLVSGAADLDSEISKDGGTFADCTNEATEIATNSGMYYLDLTSTEMNADTVAIIVKTSTSGAKTTPLVMYPVEDGDIPVNVRQIEGADPSDTIRDAVVDDATRIDASALNTLSGSAPTAGEIADAVWDEALADHNTEDSFGNVINDLVDEDGGGVYQFNSNALELAPTGSGSGDWTADEKEQIRYRLQLDGTQTAPAADAPLQMPVSADAIAQDADAAPVLRDSLSSTTIPHIRASVQLWRGDVPANLDGQSVQSYADLYEDSLFAIADYILDELLSGHTTAGTVGERLGRIPNAAAGGNGGLPTVNASNQVAGVSGNVDGSIGSLATQAKADVNAEVDTALADVNLDHLVGTADGIPAVPAGTFLDQIMDDGTETYDRTTDSLQAIRDNQASAGPSAGAIADAVWDEATSGHNADGSFGELAAEILSTVEGLPSAAEVNAEVVDALSTDTIAELGEGEPPTTPTLTQALMLLYMALRNASETERTGATTLLRKIRNAAGTVIAQGSMTQSSTSLNQGTLEAPPETP